jgi:hypothetical protein
MNWDSQIQVGLEPSGAGSADAGQVGARQSAPEVQGRQEGDQDHVQDAGHFVRTGHRPRPDYAPPFLVIRRAETGGILAERWKET